MEVAITAIGNAVPRYKQAQSKTFDAVIRWLQLNKIETRLLKTIYKEAGIEYRHSVLADFTKLNERLTFFPNNVGEDFPSTQKRMKIYKENALSLALLAVEDCLSSIKNFKKEEITHVITISCTGMSAPGLDIELIESLKLPYSTKRTTINFMGCYGVFNGLKMAYSICKADPEAKVLLVSVEMCTIHFQKEGSLDNLISSTIFSDGAGVALIEGKPSKQCFILKDFYCDMVMEGQRDMTWEIGNYGFDIRLSSYVPRLIEKGIGEFVEKMLKRGSVEIKDINYFAIHPGSKKILEACEEALKIDPRDNRFSYEVLREYGNMSSATTLFVLRRIWESVDKKDDGKKVFSCAFGPGLTMESMLLDVSYV